MDQIGTTARTERGLWRLRRERRMARRKIYTKHSHIQAILLSIYVLPSLIEPLPTLTNAVHFPSQTVTLFPALMTKGHRG